jgi:hypothetical protein
LRRPTCDPSKQWVVEVLARWIDFVLLVEYDDERITHAHTRTHTCDAKGYCSLMLLHHRDTPVGEIVYLDLPCVVAAVMC